jgi:hypothetical protein
MMIFTCNSIAVNPILEDSLVHLDVIIIVISVGKHSIPVLIATQMSLVNTARHIFGTDITADGDEFKRGNYKVKKLRIQ